MSLLRSSWQRWSARHPLARLAIVAVVAVVLAELSPWHLNALSLGGLAALLWILQRRGRHPGLWLGVVALGYAGLHVARLDDTLGHPLRQRLLALPDSPQPVTLQARLLPWSDGAEWDESQALAELTRLRWGREATWQPLAGVVRVALPPDVQVLQPGLWEIEGQLALPSAPMNPGQFDASSYSLRQGWVAVVRARQIRLIQREPWSPRFHLLHWAETSRQWIKEELARGLEGQESETAVLLAMALGASDAAGEDIEDAFRDSGTLHIFAVSGLHVVMLAGVMAFALRWFGIGQARSAGWLIVLVFAYAYITGWRPSAARAAFMIAIVLAAPWWNRRGSVENSLGAALLVLLALDTQQLFQPGFQLSFLVLWSIAFLAAPMLKMLRPWTELDPFLPVQVASPAQRAAAGLRQWLASLLCVSLAAWLGSLPLTLGHFQTVTPIGLVANLFLVPISGVSIAVSCASLGCAALGLVSLQVWVNALNAFLAKVMVLLATWFSSLPLAHFTLDLRFEPKPPPIALQVFHLPGGGAANHLRAGSDHWLIDSANVRLWRRVMRPFFRLQGINQLEGVILTHSDVAHVGAADLAYRLGRPRLHTSLHEPWPLDPPLASIHRLTEQVPVDSLGWHRHQMDDVIPMAKTEIGPVMATVLHPLPSDQNEKADDRGLVLMLHLGPCRVLWLADAGFITEKKLLERRLPIACDVLVRGQHASDVCGLTELLLAARPRVIISSSDSRAAEQTIPSSLRHFCQERQIPLLDQEICGAVSLEVEADRVRIHAFRQDREILLPLPASKP